LGGRLKSPGPVSWEDGELHRADSRTSWFDRAGSSHALTTSRSRASVFFRERPASRSPAWQMYNSPPLRSPGPDALPLMDMSSRSLTFDERRSLAVDTMLSLLMDEARKPFDLRDDSLIRVILAKVTSEPPVHYLLLNLHHSVTDGRSLAVLRHELTTVYNQNCLKQAVQLPALSMQYQDYAYWQRQWMAQGRLDKELAYWRVQLQSLPALQVPTDFPRPPTLPLEGGQVCLQFPAALANRLRSLARAKGATLFTVLLGLFAVVLGRYGGALDLAIASPVANRHGPAVEQLIGYFVNTVIFRVSLQKASFEELLMRLRDVVLGAFKHASVPYAVVLEAAQLDAAAIPAMFVLQDKDEMSWSMEGLRVEQVELERTAALFDVTCEMQEMPGTSGGLQGFIVYNKHLWTLQRAERFAQAFQALATAIAEEPAADLLTLPVTSTSERTCILEWGGHNKPSISPTPLIKTFQMQLLQCRHEPAILVDDRTVTYEEFGTQVTALAAALKLKLGQAFGESLLVGLLLARSVDLAVAIWATLGAGAAYVPIDPEYPLERIKHILENAQPKLVMCREAQRHFCGNLEVWSTQEWPISSSISVEHIEQAPPLHLAYVIYTSGSTGKPKGVAVEHRAAANMAREQIALMKISREDRVLQFFKPAFDGAVQEYLSTFCAGACLVLWGEDTGFAQALKTFGVTCATLTPSALSVLSPLQLPKLQKLAVAAESCPPSLVDTWARGRHLVNAYGPSENTVVSTWAELDGRELSRLSSFIIEVEGGADDIDRRSSLSEGRERATQHVPIGRPVMGVQCYVFEATRCKALQPIGAPGELCLGGDQLARGYYRDPVRTAEKFVPNPLNGKRMYKTGDLVMWLPSSELLYLGRNDEMVKVRGFRIELTEVEAALGALGAQAERHGSLSQFGKQNPYSQ
ncbi:Linear gramicidin synthase subunit C [Includes: ATP-dependent valine adenylase (ValA) (Valine activase), partial [Durusdinium trenchii]